MEELLGRKLAVLSGFLKHIRLDLVSLALLVGLFTAGLLDSFDLMVRTEDLVVISVRR